VANAPMPTHLVGINSTPNPARAPGSDQLQLRRTGMQRLYLDRPRAALLSCWRGGDDSRSPYGHPGRVLRFVQEQAGVHAAAPVVQGRCTSRPATVQ
jgi:hypothetical protein